MKKHKNAEIGTYWPETGEQQIGTLNVLAKTCLGIGAKALLSFRESIDAKSSGELSNLTKLVAFQHCLSTTALSEYCNSQ